MFLKGQTAGGGIGEYSSSNFGDIKLYLNFPDEFVEAVKKICYSCKCSFVRLRDKWSNENLRYIG